MSKPAATLTFKVWIIRIITLGTKLYSNDLVLKAIKGAKYPKYFMIYANEIRSDFMKKLKGQ